MKLTDKALRNLKSWSYLKIMKGAKVMKYKNRLGVTPIEYPQEFGKILKLQE